MTRPVYLVGLAGPAGVGKSTVAQALCELAPTFRRHRFAGLLKDMLRELGLTEDEVDGTAKTQPCALLGGKTPRHAMRTLGTEWGRNCIDPDLWVRATMHRAKADLAAGFGVVIDDVRFDNEAHAIRTRGGVIVKLTRRGVQVDDSHSSEAGVSDYLISYIVRNDAAPEAAARDIAFLLKYRNPNA